MTFFCARKNPRNFIQPNHLVQMCWIFSFKFCELEFLNYIHGPSSNSQCKTILHKLLGREKVLRNLSNILCFFSSISLPTTSLHYHSHPYSGIVYIAPFFEEHILNNLDSDCTPISKQLLFLFQKKRLMWIVWHC